ncbi:hypothetical protein [Methylobacterium sp. UNC378MF]|nr:hypothetical protein [Methylobacterium sp. UNC378MF]
MSKVYAYSGTAPSTLDGPAWTGIVYPDGGRGRQGVAAVARDG